MSDSNSPLMTPFVKMHGLGNDFVVIDARDRAFQPDKALAAAIADRRLGIGFDQMLVMRPPRDPRADIFMSIYNADGGEVEACGNGTRCVARRIMAESGRSRVIVETVAGLLDAHAAPEGQVAVDMGYVRTDWSEIPLKESCDTLHVPLELGPLSDPVAGNVGNPHATFFVNDTGTPSNLPTTRKYRRCRGDRSKSCSLAGLGKGRWRDQGLWHWGLCSSCCSCAEEFN